MKPALTPGRLLGTAVVVVALVFAIQGGEYSTLDYLELRRSERWERREIARLTRMVDSLEKVAVAVETDPRAQERVAREEFGMIREGELLYRLVP